MPFQPGHKLAVGGRKEKPFRDALKLALIKRDPEKKGINPALMKVAETLLDEAEAGESWAVIELINRIDGKVAQPVAGDEDNPLTLIHRIESIIVDAANPDSESLPAPVESEPI